MTENGIKKVIDYFDQSENIVCLRKGDKVIFQNDSSIRACQVENKNQCEQRCLPLLKEAERSRPSKNCFIHLENKVIEGQSYQFICFKEAPFTLTVLISEDVQSKYLKPFYQDKGLTPREIEIKILKDFGLKNEEISKNLYISLSTVKKHINNISRKLNS